MTPQTTRNHLQTLAAHMVSDRFSDQIAARRAFRRMYPGEPKITAGDQAG